jgi:hypothetical protein
VEEGQTPPTTRGPMVTEPGWVRPVHWASAASDRCPCGGSYHDHATRFSFDSGSVEVSQRICDRCGSITYRTDTLLLLEALVRNALLVIS